MASYKTIKQLRDEAKRYDGITSDTGFIADLAEAALRLGAAAEHQAIKAHIMKSDYSDTRGSHTAGRILDFINTRRARIDKAAGGLGKQSKKTKVTKTR